MQQKLFRLKDIQALTSLVVLALTTSIGTDSTIMTLVAGVFLALAISTSVHNAELIAEGVGPALGTLILAISVTIIEVGLIISLMQNSFDSSATIARDTVFAAIMIVANGIMGMSIFWGSLKHGELGFQQLGTSSLMSMLVVLSAFTMILPNYTTSTVGPTYSDGQLIFVSIISLVIYFVLIWAQTKSFKGYFAATHGVAEESLHKPSRVQMIVALVGLIASLLAVVGLSKALSPTIGAVVQYLGAPQSAVGIVVALLVLAPETFAALNASKANQLQTSLNLALGSGVASIALTIPIVSAYTIWMGQPLVLGLEPKSQAFLMLTFIASGFTLGASRTTALHGLVHLFILIGYLALSFIP